jgi:signal transduction histidine kinase
MLKRSTIPLLLLLVVFTGFGQSLEEYQQTYRNSTDPAERLVALDSVLSRIKQIDLNSFSDYSQEYIDLALELDSVELAGRKLISVARTITNVQNQPRRVITLVDLLLARRYKIDNKSIIGRLYLQRGKANYRLDLNASIEDYQKALAEFGPNDTIFIADAYLFSGQSYSNLGEFVKASESYGKAHDLYESLDDHEYMFYAQQGITTMWSMNGFHEIAMEEREKNIAEIKKLGIEHHLATEYYNQALDYEQVGDEKKSMEYLLLAKDELARHKGQPGIAVLIYAKLVEYYSYQYLFEEAEKYLTEVESNYENSSGDNFIRSQYNGAKAAYSFANGDYDRALRFAKEKLGYARSLDDEEDIMASHQLLSRIYSEMGDYRRSLDEKDAYMAIKDSIYNRSAASSLAYYQTLYETAKKEKELVEQSSNIELLERNNTYFKRLTIAVTLISIMALGLFIVMRNQRSLKQRKQLQEKFSQELLASQEEERMRISKDLHDGLGQQLLVIKNRLVTEGNEATSKMVDQSIEEVRSISRDLHPFQLQEMGLTRALEHTVKQIDEHTSLFISSEIDNIDEIFTPEQEVNIYRMVQECLSNIIKHARAEAGKIVVKRGEQNVSIVIKDNGVGFDFQKQYYKRNSLGLKTLMERSKFLNGQLKVRSRADRGTEFEFQIPIA